MNNPLLQLALDLIKVMGPPGLFVVAWIWERRRTSVVVDRHLVDQKKVYEDFLREQRELYERYLADMRDWSNPRGQHQVRYEQHRLEQPGGGEMRPFPAAIVTHNAPGD